MLSTDQDLQIIMYEKLLVCTWVVFVTQIILACIIVSHLVPLDGVKAKEAYVLIDEVKRSKSAALTFKHIHYCH